MPGTLSSPRVAVLTPTSFDFYCTDNFIDFGVVAIITRDAGAPSVEQILQGQDATGSDV